MARHYLKPAACLLAALSMSSCGLAEPFSSVLLGNYAFQRGDYHRATVLYNRALEADRYKPWVLYNLGNVYRALGENEPAFEVWDPDSYAEWEQLQYRVSFNRGTIFYQQGRYRDALSSFRHALEVSPGAVEAKVNLELSLRKMQAAGEAARMPEEPVDSGTDPGTAERVLDYVNTKEAKQWESAESTPPDGFSADW
jgi:Ca-activated chloride channel family protein